MKSLYHDSITISKLHMVGDARGVQGMYDVRRRTSDKDIR